MTFDRIIETLAHYPLEKMLTVSSHQDRDDSTLCSCPLCDGDNDHFRIYRDKDGGAYEKRCTMWRCQRTGKFGYGAVELQAAIMGLSMEGKNLYRVLWALAERIGFENMENELVDDLKQECYKAEVDAQPKTTFQLIADFTQQHLEALGCRVTYSPNREQIMFGFQTSEDADMGVFDSSIISKEFRIYPVRELVTEQKTYRGRSYSVRYVASAWNPIFVCLYDDFKGPMTAAGRFLFPAHPELDFTFSNCDDPSREAFNRRMGGDRVWYEWRKRCVKGRGSVPAAVEAAANGEVLTTCRKEWQYDEYEEKWRFEPRELKAEEQRVHNVVYCTSIYDAIPTFFAVRALRMSYTDNADLSNLYMHVCFPYGLTADFANRQFSQMRNFAEETFILPPAESRAQRKALSICRRFRTMRRACLPENFQLGVNNRFSLFYGRECMSVRDFFAAYVLTPEERLQYDGDLRKMFLTSLTSALSANPFVRREKRDKKTGELTEEYFEVDSANLWEFMGAEGYCRDVKPNDTNKIGRYVRLVGPFADELDVASMVAVTQQCLDDYARSIARPGTDDYAKMKRAISKCKDINQQQVAKLPAIKVNYSDGYGKEIDHVFLHNVSVCIEKDSISTRDYSDLNFNVDRAEMMDWDFRMPQGGAPFSWYENPEYTRRKEELEQHRQDPNYTLRQISIEQNELEQWKADHRWQFDFNGKKFDELWPIVRVMLCFANEQWDEEERLHRLGKEFDSDQRDVLYGHFANLLFALGRMLYRYRTNKSNCILYLMENKAQDGKAEGGSGKSTLVNLIAASCCHVLVIDCRKYKLPEDQNKQMGNYKHHCHRIVHFEDQVAGVEHLYNYTTSGFTYERKFEQPVFVPLKEAPAIVCSSNYALRKTDDSSVRRVCMTGFSHRFCGANIMKNKAARLISDVMPGFSTNLELWSDEDRNQAIYLCAMAVQFVMQFDEKIEAPQEDVRNRTMVSELGESFTRFASVFFSNPKNFGAPIDLCTAMDEYISAYCDTSEERKDKYTLKNFKQRMADYCSSKDILMNPDNLYPSEQMRARGYFRRKAWVVQHYFEGKAWEGDTTVHAKRIRRPDSSLNVVYFFRNGQEPKTREELEELNTKFWEQHGVLDPDPILDENGNPEVLTEEETERWQNYLSLRQGKGRKAASAPAMPTASGEVEPPKDEELPF